MTLEEKAGLMFYMIAGVNPDGSLNPPRDGFSRGMPIAESVGTLLLNHFNVHALPAPRLTAQWYNNLQALAESTRLGIPVTISSDPRHAFSNNPLTSFFAGAFSQWRSRSAWPPPATPHWSNSLAISPGRNIWRSAFAWRCTQWPTWPPSRAGRINGTFGEDAQLSARLTAAYIRGFQGAALGPGQRGLYESTSRRRPAEGWRRSALPLWP